MSGISRQLKQGKNVDKDLKQVLLRFAQSKERLARREANAPRPAYDPELPITAHRDEILAISRRHSARFEEVLEKGIGDGSIAPCDVRMTGNAIMGSINWIPKWHHGDAAMGDAIVAEFPVILTRGLIPD